MEAGICKIIALAGGRNCAHIADMLHHSCYCKGDDGDNSAYQKTGVNISGEETEDGVFHFEGESEPGGFFNGGEINIAGNCGEYIGNNNAQQNRNDLDHTFAPDVTYNNNYNCGSGDPPVSGAVGNSGAGKAQTDGNNDRTGYNGREVAHYFPDTENLEKCCQNHI